jgi:LAO/AO transport system kinase
VPESGDSIQAMKSGLMEIADLFVLNKSDRDGADQAVTALKTILTFRITHAANEWIPNVIKAVATTGDGVEDIVAMIESHRNYMMRVGIFESRRAERERRRVERLAEAILHHSFWTPERLSLLQDQLPLLVQRQRSPLQVAHQLIDAADIVHGG